MMSLTLAGMSSAFAICGVNRVPPRPANAARRPSGRRASRKALLAARLAARSSVRPRVIGSSSARFLELSQMCSELIWVLARSESIAVAQDSFVGLICSVDGEC